jgi:two-component system response regulator TctD
VLVVEDEPSLRSLLGRYLSAKGVEVVCCSTAAEALATCRERTFSACVVDVSLPDGSGLDLVVALNAARPGMLHVVSSGLPVSEQEIGLPADAAWAVLQKPYLPNKLWSMLEPALRGRAAAAG